jgi:Icc-related predicted phosphoesterase
MKMSNLTESRNKGKSMSINRRNFLKLAGYAGVVVSSGLPGLSYSAGKISEDEFYFVQLSDTHWGFNKKKLNADAKGTLPKAIDLINALEHQPDFIVFTGDLTHSTDDPKLRRARMAEFRNIVSKLKNKNIRFLPGEHDASLDNGAAYQEFFGDLHYTFDHKGIHFIALDNVSDPRAQLGKKQLDWLRADLNQLNKDAPIVVLTHRPLFELESRWGWSTKDGVDAINMLKEHSNVTVFYGHIHQEHHHQTAHIKHHSARSLIFPLVKPGAEKKGKIAWDPQTPYKGLGIRNVEVAKAGSEFDLYELGLQAKKSG